MEDFKIVDLYWSRSETAISESEQKYGKILRSLSFSLLSSYEDAEECVNDTYLKAWNSMPPERPDSLSAYLGKLTRNLALNRYAYQHADKRNIHLTEIYDEATQPFADSADMLDEMILREAINTFLASLSAETRILFMRRYWYMSPVKQIARDYGLPEGTVKSILSRTRKKFKDYLEKEGIYL